MWAITETADTEHARIFVQGKALSLLMSAVADEVDRLLFKSNVMYNGTPTVAPETLVGVLTQQLNHAVTEVMFCLAVGCENVFVPYIPCW